MSTKKKKSASYLKARVKKRRFNTVGGQGISKEQPKAKEVTKQGSRRTQGYNFYKRGSIYSSKFENLLILVNVKIVKKIIK